MSHLLHRFFSTFPRVRPAPGAWVLAVLLLSGVPARAQNVVESFTPYLNAFDLREMVDDGQGHLWIASNGGALRFNYINGEWAVFPRGLGTGPRGNDLVTVNIDSGGRIWWGSAGNGFTFLDPLLGTWDRDSEEWPDPRIRVIRALGDGVFIGTQNGLALKTSPTRTDICADSDPGCIVPSFIVNDYARNGDTLWVATQKGLGRFNGSTWDSASALPPGSVGQESLSLQRFAGDLWEATPTAVRRLRNGVWTSFPMQTTRLRATGGQLYAIRVNGASVWQDSVWTDLAIPVTGVGQIRDLLVVGGEFYLATSAGLVRWQGGASLSGFYYPPTPPFTGVYSGLTHDRSGTLWAATSEHAIGLARFDGTRWTGIQTGVLPQWILGLMAGQGDEIWVGHCCCGIPSQCPLQIVDGGTIEDFASVLNARAFDQDREGRIWIGTQGFGVYVLEPDPGSGGWTIAFNLTPESTGGKLASSQLASILVTDEGTYFGHLSDGVDYWPHGGDLVTGRNGAGWQRISVSTGDLLDNNALALASVRGDVWVGTSSGLHRFRGDVLLERCPTRDRESPTDPVRKVNAIVGDALGAVWLGTDTGVLYYPRGAGCDLNGGDFLAFDDRNSPLPTNRVSTADVSPTDGSIWFGTARGFLRVDPTAFTGSAPPPDRYILFPNPLNLSPGARSGERTVFFGQVVAGLSVVAVPADSVSQPEVLDLSGRSVGVFEIDRSGPGSGAWAWGGTNRQGDFVAPGIYVVRVRTASGEVVTRKVGVIR